jgi:enamine deaminase RidA (YjgF/YER057c/UK114 family)
MENPIPQGKYKAAVRHKDMIFTSGMTPRVLGELRFSGTIRSDLPLATYQEAIELAAKNALTAAKSCLKENETLQFIPQLSVFLNTEEGFKDHAKLANYASEEIIRQLGEDAIGSRAAIGVASLPGDACVEITLIATVNQN